MKRGGPTNPALRAWILGGILLMLVGLVMHWVGRRSFDLPWLVITIVAAVVIVVGFSRHGPRRS